VRKQPLSGKSVEETVSRTHFQACDKWRTLNKTLTNVKSPLCDRQGCKQLNIATQHILQKTPFNQLTTWQTLIIIYFRFFSIQKQNFGAVDNVTKQIKNLLFLETSCKFHESHLLLKFLNSKNYSSK